MPLQQLSDGNLQKAFIGRALVQNTSVIILDEPTTHLDEKNKTIVLTTLRMLAKNIIKQFCFPLMIGDWQKNFLIRSGILKKEDYILVLRRIYCPLIRS